jgi:hypothetical protein
MAVDRHGRTTKVAAAVLIFVALWSVIDLPIQTIAVGAIGAALILVWVLDILTSVVSYYRNGGRGGRNKDRTPFDVIRYYTDRRTPQATKLTSTATVLLAVIVVVSATVGTGIAALDTATPSVAAGSIAETATESVSGPDRPPNEAAVGGSFGTIRLHNNSREVTLNVEDTDGVDGVILVGPEREQIASSDISVGTRQLTLRSSRPHRNGTYEIIGVERGQASEDVPLPELDEAESHEVQLNISA